METEHGELGGRPTSALRWTIGLACKEFDLAPATLAKRIRLESIEPGKDGRYSTPQIVKAVFGGNESASRIKLNDARTTLANIEIETARAERVPLALVVEDFDKALSEIVQILRSVRGKEMDELTTADMLAAFRA